MLSKLFKMYYIYKNIGEIESLIKDMIDAVRDDEIDKEEFKSLKKRAYNLLVDLGFYKEK